MEKLYTINWNNVFEISRVVTPYEDNKNIQVSFITAVIVEFDVEGGFKKAAKFSWTENDVIIPYYTSNIAMDYCIKNDSFNSKWIIRSFFYPMHNVNNLNLEKELSFDEVFELVPEYKLIEIATPKLLSIEYKGKKFVKKVFSFAGRILKTEHFYRKVLGKITFQISKEKDLEKLQHLFDKELKT